MIDKYLDFIKNMGFWYILYRVYHVFLIKSGLIKLKFPTKSNKTFHLQLSRWRGESSPFFFSSREVLGNFNLDFKQSEILRSEYQKIISGQIQFFNYRWLNVGYPIDWHHNPDSGYTYPSNIHWAYLPDLSMQNGDIKYVWEKSRFGFLFTIIRYDQHFGHDSSQFVFQQIESWINENKINLGPNYKCSQEISLRLFNWIFALYFYKNSKYLTDALFEKIIESIQLQLDHVYENIHFSRLTVRNNHAITETLCLYIVSVLFPTLKDAAIYKQKGKKYFEREIEYQIYPDGSYLQFSMNYHRVVVQLITWAMRLAHLNGEKFSPIVYERAAKTLDFLYNHQDDKSGKLPNYGANDGALFFKLNSEEYLVHSPQLNGLQYALNGTILYDLDKNWHEDVWWYSGGGDLESIAVQKVNKKTIFEAKDGGFFVIRGNDSFSMLRCGNHKDRPQQADQNHLDIWYLGNNIIRDNGTYKYNTSLTDLNYFMGTASHNTVQVGDANQMLKGGRFIWYYWSQAKDCNVKEYVEYSEIHTVAIVYKYIKGGVLHHRRVKKYHDQLIWEIEDVLRPLGNLGNTNYKQNWHLADGFQKMGFVVKSFDKLGNELSGKYHFGWNSQYYGEKTESLMVTFENIEPYFLTKIYKT